MSRGIDALITPSVMEWARKKAGLDPLAAANKIGRPIDEILKWEAGEIYPSLPQARKAAEVYRRSLAVFFLPEPPFGVSTLRDFRHLPIDRPSDFSPELCSVIQDIEYRQEWLRDYLKEEGVEPLDYIGSASTSMNAKEVGEMIRSKININPENHLSLNSRRDVLNLWINESEKIGINICREGGIDIEEARGFVITDEYAPFIFLNNSDSFTGRLFTLVHELAHLWINAPGISNRFAIQREGTNIEENIEVFCNRVASHTLLSESEFQIIWKGSRGRGNHEDRIYYISNRLKISEEVIARRLLDNMQMTVENYQLLRAKYLDRWRKYKKEEAKKRQSREEGGGPSPHLLRVQKNGKIFTQLVLTTYYNGTISGAEASRLLQWKVNNFHKVAEKAGLKSITSLN